MNYLKIISIPLFLFLLSCSGASENTTTNSTDKKEDISSVKSESFTVSPSVFKEKLEAEAGTILDVRTPEEVAEGTIPNAIVININDADFETRLNQLDKSKPVYVYCKAGGRSSKATEMMMKNNFSKVYNLDGGIESWIDEGFNIVKK